jgi:5-carboxymethyl-2-hydroxymuconate isomerase
MPQLSLKISKNIDITRIDFQKLFVEIHEALRDVPNMDITTCHSGVIQEDFSYIGLGDVRLTKMYLEVYWLEDEKRLAMKKKLAQKLMKLLEDIIVPQIEEQKLICIPRVRIANLGKLEQEYFISTRQS